MIDTISKFPVAYTRAHTIEVYTCQNTSHRLKRSVIFFHPEREKALPEYIPALECWFLPLVGLDLTHFSYFFLLPSILNKHNSKFPDSLLPTTWSKDELLAQSSQIENIFSHHCLIMSFLFSSMLSLYFAFHFFYW